MAALTSPEDLVIVEKCCARVGFLGNPSDGFHGKTLSFLIDNFAATVTISPSPGPLTIVEEAVFDDLLHVYRHSSLLGYTSGLRLVQATCKVFCQRALAADVSEALLRGRGGVLCFHTTIPRMVGLSGSSAIVTATFRALLRLFGLTLADLRIAAEALPAVLLGIEQDELGIKAGLQDRVVQAYGGLVFMDFSDPHGHRFEPLDVALLPPLYLLYNTDAGGDSGAVHSTVRQRFDAGDDAVRRGMKEIASLAAAAVECLTQRHFSRLADLVDRNFALRRELYGDDVVGPRNVVAALRAQQLGFAVKFTGSGGSFLALHRPSICAAEGAEVVRWLDAAEEARLRATFAELHFAFERVQPAERPR